MCRKAYTEIEKYFDRTFKALAICGNCPDCYDLGRSMIAVCRQPHILLWVSFAGFNYWPAKFMDVDENSGRLNVVFFGDYTAATVPSKSVYLFSWQFPDKGIPPTSSLYKTFLVAWNVSVEGLSQYVLLRTVLASSQEEYFSFFSSFIT